MKLTNAEENYIISTYGLLPEELPDYEVIDAITEFREMVA